MNHKRLIPIADSISLFPLLLLFAAALVNTHWSLNPLFDVLLARFGGAGPHSFSMLMVTGVPLILMIRTWGKIPAYTWVLASFGTAFFHEISIVIWNLAAGHALAFPVAYLAFLAVFAILAVHYCTEKQKQVLAFVYLYCLVTMFVYVIFLGNSDLQSIADGPSFIINSFVEVIGWVGASLLWVFA